MTDIKLNVTSKKSGEIKLMYLTEQLSNCCKAQALVSSSDEGTSCFVCERCKRPCDAHPVEWSPGYEMELLEPGGILVNKGEYKIMKEQVSVGKIIINHIDVNGERYIKKEDYEFLTKEYERFKRLDENVRRRIAMHASQLPDGAASSNTQLNILERIEFLKSLYDENTQEG